MSTRLKDPGTVSSTGRHLYPLGDRVPGTSMLANNLRATPTGEKRPPKRGEWYLSGGIVHAHLAPNDLTTPYHIATIVQTRTVTVTSVIIE